MFGSLQNKPKDQTRVMMACRQTTGVYAKIATVISVDLPEVAQCQPGYQVRILVIPYKQALKFKKQEEKNRAKFRRKCEYYRKKRGKE